MGISRKIKILWQNKRNVIGKLKDGTKGVPMVGFAVLKSKIYSLIKEDNEGHKNAREINKNVVKNMANEEYENMLLKRNKWDTKWKECKVNLKLNLKLTKFMYHALMINDIFFIMDLKLYHIGIKILISYFDSIY